jgi:RNA polymerase sigma-32 factor
LLTRPLAAERSTKENVPWAAPLSCCVGDSVFLARKAAVANQTTFAEQQETVYRHQALEGAIAMLNPRQRRIFTARWLTDELSTLEELAAEYGVSRERVRQIEQRAFQKVQAAMQGYGRGAGGKQPDLYRS